MGETWTGDDTFAGTTSHSTHILWLPAVAFLALAAYRVYTREKKVRPVSWTLNCFPKGITAAAGDAGTHLEERPVATI